MAKRFKTKKKIKFKYAFILGIFFLFITFFYTFNFLYNNFFKKVDNEELIGYLVNYNLNTNNDKNLLYDLINLNSTDFLLKYTLGLEPIKEDSNESVVGLEAEYIEDPYEVVITEPIIYIYNTHQTEGYKMSNNSSYNITPSVLMASYILRESLNDLGIPSLVETNDITEILRINNWKYKYSYAASKILMEDAKSKNPSLKYFIDIHRDSANYDTTTLTINNNSYAKVLFVIGSDHENYQKNQALAEKISNLLNNQIPGISRGVSVKGGDNVNGIYNQDFNENTILIELGGQYNTITEINNTIKILSRAIHKYIEGVL